MPMPACPRATRRAGWRRAGQLGALGLAVALAVVPVVPAVAAPAAAPPAYTVLAWGDNQHGQLGNGTTTPSSLPNVVRLPRNLRYSTVRSQQVFGVAVSTSGQVFAWGSNLYGQLGNGSTTSRLKPVRVRLPAGVRVKTARAGSLFTLALTTRGKVLAWGFNGDGELGNGSTRSRSLPVAVKLPRGVTITAISAGDDSALALTKTGRVLSWGSNLAGQLGNGTGAERHVPGYVRLPGHTKITSIAAGNKTGYAVTSAGKVLAWGLNEDGELGDGTTRIRETPVPVRLPGGAKVVAATAGLFHVLALTRAGKVLAWGSNTDGQLGNGSTTDRHVPVWARLPTGTRKITALTAGRYFSMALTAGHRILAWGLNDEGQLGDGSTMDRLTPVVASNVDGFAATAIGAGFNSATALAIGPPVRD
jgi:alpha-tubulin suppressor-like RCC1 family protein